MQISVRTSISLLALALTSYGQQMFWALNQSAVASASFDVGFDFRETYSTVSDPPYATFVQSGIPNGSTQSCPGTDGYGKLYPTTCTVNGISVTFGWESATSDQLSSYLDQRTFNSSNDPRFAGDAMVTYPHWATFRVDLPSAGSYKVQVLVGDGRGYAGSTKLRIVDGTQTGTPVWAGPGASPPCATDGSHAYDVNCSAIAVSGSMGPLASTNALTFATTTFRLYFDQGSLNHLRITKQ